MNTAIVLGYGLFEESNQEYKNYLDWICSEVDKQGLELVVLCGGTSNDLHPEISEAESIQKYFQKVKPQLQLVLENKSLTTTQNIRNAAQIIDRNSKIIVFGDLVRYAKIIWISLALLLDIDRSQISLIMFDFVKDRKLKPFVYKNLSVLPFDFPSRDKYSATEQSFSSLLEVEALYEPNLDEKITQKRKEDFGIS